MDEVCEVLEEMGITYEKNKYIDDVLIADIFIPDQYQFNLLLNNESKVPWIVLFS